MAFNTRCRFPLGTALALLIALSGAAQAEEAVGDTKPAPVVQFDASSVDTFAGAFLAARTADNDYDYASAITLYKTALKYDPSNVEVRQRLMISLFMNGNFDEGVAEGEKLKNDPAVERIATIARGIDAIRKQKYADAYTILKYDGPNELDRMINTLIMAWGQFGEGKAKDAIAAIDKMEGPEWYGIFKNYNAGMIAAASGDLEAARKRLSETVANREEGGSASDTYMRAVLALASLEAKAGNRQKALDAISVGEAFAPDYVPLAVFRKTIESGAKPDFVVKSASEGVSSVLFSVGAALNQSVTNAPDRQSAQDIVAFYLVTAYALAPSADTAVLLGGLSESLEQPERAIEWYKRVPADSPLRRVSELQLGLNLANTGKTEEARQHLKAALAADPNDIRGYLAYASLLSDQKEYAEMAKTYDKAVEIIGPLPKRKDWSVFFQRGIAYERLKKWDLAEPNFEKALELYPDQPQVLNYLGYSWVDMNIKLETGLDMIRKAADLRPDDGYIVDSLGWAYYRLGRFEDAVGELERAVELKAADATINDHLGDAYWRVGRKLEAIFQWRTALSVKPEEAEIPKIRKKIKEGLPEIEVKKAEQKPADATRNVEVAAAVPAGQAKDAIKLEEPKPATDPVAAEPKADDKAVQPALHTVNKGDSLWNIAKEILGDGQRFMEIIDLNPELKRYPDRIQPGQMLKLPETKN
ncbi:tetratricopeptide repeat protein [Rhizobium sp. TH2]|uniref:tetratricopeptide repeat protein n=1 Tax=Rhizobium sp. TH2 TaxID=2775403 RepID=UPI0021584A16|nr:tetratricopeptide repeat protein [Rhizobium sp. TH2]UVC10037.1 tetratricopeptide repeat protein [Rhizobium sp. TH2]